MFGLKHVHAQMARVGHPSVLVDEADGFRWRVTIEASKCPPALAKTLRTARCAMVWHVVFPEDFPMTPPFVHVVSPTFAPVTGHVLQGGALCAEVLSTSESSSAWRPTIQMAALVETLLHTMNEGGPRVRDVRGRFSEDDARQGFRRVVSRYGWER